MSIETENSKKVWPLLADFFKNKTFKVPGFKDFKEKRIKDALFPDDNEVIDSPYIFPFPKEYEVQHVALEAYVALYQSIMDLSDYQYYFRRFPFKEGDISKHNYIRITCENYLSAFYVIKERLKNYFNKMKEAGCISNESAGLIIRNFEKRFDHELRQRNSKHHREDFTSENIKRLSVLKLFAPSGEKATEFLDREHRLEFKQYMRQWHDRVILRSQHLSEYLDIASQILIASTSFIHEENGFECKGMVRVEISKKINNSVSDSSRKSLVGDRGLEPRTR